MIRFVFSPEWFYGFDSLLEIFSIIAAFLVAYYSLKMYRFSKNVNYKYFSLAFFMLSVAFIIKILTNIIVYFELLEHSLLGTVNVLVSEISSIEFVYIIGYLGYRFLFLMALLGIYMVSYKKTSEKDILLFAYFVFIVCALSHYYFSVFHLTAIILISLIFNFYIQSYKKKKNTNTLLIALSFLILMISQFLYFLIYLNHIFYVAAEISQLIGFILLIIVMIRLK